MEIYWKAMEQITWYTGLSPMAFFTILASMIFVFQMVSSMFVSPEELNKPPTVPISSSNPANSNLFVNDSVADASQAVQVGRLTEQQLRAFDGSDPNKPLLMAIKGQIYDVSSGRMFYGPGSPYSMFVGKDASRALALLSFKPEDINGNIEGLSEEELVILQDWEYKFMEKYVKVGELVPEGGLNEHSENGHQNSETDREEEHDKDQLDSFERDLEEYIVYQRKMDGRRSYVPPAYVPLGQSDSEAEIISRDEDHPTPNELKDGLSQWSSGICACCDDMQSCFIGLFCPCFLFGKNAELLGSRTMFGSCATHFILWALMNTVCCLLTDGFLLNLPGCFLACYACGYRKALRSKYNLPEAPCGDFVTHFFCHFCAICQEYREIRERAGGSGSHDLNLAVVTPPTTQTMESNL